jgi:hypothetical protein
MSGKRPTYGEEGQAPFRKRTWLRILVLFGISGIIVSALCLLSGCGSDSKPGAVSGKKEKTGAGPNAMKSSVALPLGNLSDGSGPGTLKKAPNAAQGTTAEQVEEKFAASLKRRQDPNYEILPGMTKQKLDAKMSAAQQNLQKKLESPNYEIVPGLSKQQLEAKQAAAQQNLQKRLRAANDEAVPGLTMKELQDKIEVARRKEAQRHEVLPGITKDELQDKVEAAQRKAAQRHKALPVNAKD